MYCIFSLIPYSHVIIIIYYKIHKKQLNAVAKPQNILHINNIEKEKMCMYHKYDISLSAQVQLYLAFLLSNRNSEIIATFPLIFFMFFFLLHVVVVAAVQLILFGSFSNWYYCLFHRFFSSDLIKLIEIWKASVLDAFRMLVILHILIDLLQFIQAENRSVFSVFKMGKKNIDFDSTVIFRVRMCSTSSISTNICFYYCGVVRTYETKYAIGAIESNFSWHFNFALFFFYHSM